MKIKSEIWSIKKLVLKKKTINPKPQYQRTSVWNTAKKSLLIDSILRNYDLPKFYLTKTGQSLNFEYEVTDGQQRMLAIWEFIECNEEKPLKLISYKKNGVDLIGLTSVDLKRDHKKLWNNFLNYELNLSILIESTPEETRSLFARLQMGSQLSPVELRHALNSNIGNLIFSIIENHKFFAECNIKNIRFKHQDYMDHVITLAHFKGTKNIKAKEIKDMYMELADTTMHGVQPMIRNSNKVLNYMLKVNSYTKGLFKNKWGFVDTFYLIYNNIDSIKDIKPKNFAANFKEFERLRKKYNKNPEVLIESKRKSIYNKDLYDYIIAFKTGGSEKSNVMIRHQVFINQFLNTKNFELI